MPGSTLVNLLIKLISSQFCAFIQINFFLITSAFSRYNEIKGHWNFTPVAIYQFKKIKLIAVFSSVESLFCYYRYYQRIDYSERLRWQIKLR